MENLKGWIAKFWAPIAGILGAITFIVQFIQLWRGDQETVTKVTWGVGAALLIISLYYVGFSKKQSPIVLTNLRGEPITRLKYQYGRFSKLARALFFISIFVIPIMWGSAILHKKELDEKVIVLIADFDGPDPKNYRVTEQLISQVINSLAGYEDTIIIPLGNTIIEQEGVSKAQELGKEYHADLVIWGWYGVTDSDVILNIHIENLTSLDFLPVFTGNLYGMQLPAKQLKSFQLQQRLSSEMTALTLQLSGLIRFEAQDYEGAILRFTDALNEEWPEGLISRKNLHFYRGLSYYILGTEDFIFSEENLKNAISDFSEAINLDNNFWQAYNYRSLSYFFLDDYEMAEKDFYWLASQPLPPYDNNDYNSFTLLCLFFEDYSKGVEFMNNIVNNNSNDADALANRSQFYMALEEYELAIQDINRAIELDPKFFGYYQMRAQIYLSMEIYNLALEDSNKALSLITSEWEIGMHSLLFYQRGRIYFEMKEFDNALEDFNTAIELSFPSTLFYENRGDAYFALEEYELAIDDYSTYLENRLDISVSDVYFNRGEAHEELEQVDDALADYANAAQTYAHFANLWDSEDEEYANKICKSAIQNFQELSENSEGLSVVRYANATVKSFTSNCPDTLISPFPRQTWVIKLATNPLIPGSSLAGIKIGDTFENVIEQLDDPFIYISFDETNIPDCCLGGAWVSENIIMAILYSNADNTKIIGFSIETHDDFSNFDWIPLVKNISIGSSEAELLFNWGNPINLQPTEVSNDCNNFYYDGIRFRICDEKIDYIEIPEFLNLR